jgi:hypothetical protein
VTKLLKGHTDYVYQVVDGSEGHLISCGEDHTAVSLSEGRLGTAIQYVDMEDSGSGILKLPTQRHYCILVRPYGQSHNVKMGM